MNKSDYNKYYKKGGTYVIPVEVFNELFDELERLSFNYEQADYKSRIDKINEIIDENKDLDEWLHIPAWELQDILKESIKNENKNR